MRLRLHDLANVQVELLWNRRMSPSRLLCENMDEIDLIDEKISKKLDEFSQSNELEKLSKMFDDMYEVIIFNIDF